MTISIDIKRVKLYIWIGVAYLLLWLLIEATTELDTFFPRLINNIWRLVYIVVINYWFLEYVVPFVLRKRRYAIYNVLLGIFFFWVISMLYSFGLFGWRYVGVLLHIHTELREFKSVQEGAGYVVPYGYLSLVFFGVIRHAYNYQKLKQATQQLRIEKQEAELNYLKSQTNPHFLFNTLNNIYSLAREKSDQAPEAIMRLSKILRFMLYETGGEYISIEQEVRVINDYIALEKLRYDESLRVNFNYDIEEMKQALPPLLLIPLVENAFKHGVSETRSQPFVDIHLSVHQRQLTFLVKNSSEASSPEVQVKENIGLSNLRRQLQLLYIDYNLSVQQFDSVFTARLNINLGSHVKNKMHHHRR
jgi:two-component system, LytTR family, sensor kinase